MSKCLSCARGFPEECDKGGCEDNVTVIEKIEVNNDENNEEESDGTGNRRTRRNKPDAALKDQQSTGRKRAAKLYPLDRNAPCEWRGRSNVGGGIGIQGCVAGTQQARHHGPDYNTLNNDSTNVSRICHVCHNRWHQANDHTKELSYLIQYGHKPKELGKRLVED